MLRKRAGAPTPWCHPHALGKAAPSFLVKSKLSDSVIGQGLVLFALLFLRSAARQVVGHIASPRTSLLGQGASTLAHSGRVPAHPDRPQ